MKILLLIFFISVIHASWEPLNIEKSISQYQGLWYVNAWTGNVDIPEDKRHQKIPPFVVRILPNGKVEAKLNLKKNGRCEEIKLTLEKTKQLGKMTTWKADCWDTEIKHRGPTNCIYRKQDEWEKRHYDETCRNTVPHPEAMKIFEQFVRSKGQDVTKIIVPELEEDCVPGRT